MPYLLKIDEKSGCAFIKWHGVFSLDENRKFRSDTADNAAFQACTKRLHDTRGVDISVPTSVIRTVAYADPVTTEPFVEVRSAILVSSEMAFGMMRMFSTMYQDPRMNMRVFRNLDDAKAWLGLPADLGDPFDTMTDD